MNNEYPNGHNFNFYECSFMGESEKKHAIGDYCSQNVKAIPFAIIFRALSGQAPHILFTQPVEYESRSNLASAVFFGSPGI